MFQQSNFTLIFYIILFSVLVTSFIRQDKTDISAITSTEYSSRLTAAAHSAMQSANTDKLSLGTAIWDTKEEREKALNTFYTALSQSFLQEADDSLLRTAIPVVVLIDEDGYYINYNVLFDDNNIDPNYSAESFLQEGNEGMSQTGSINTWAEHIGPGADPLAPSQDSWVVRYTLSDYVWVTAPDGKFYEGNRYRVAENIKNDPARYTTNGSDIVACDYLEGKTTVLPNEDFKGHKERFIIKETEDTINRFINQFNYRKMGKNGRAYHITMPRIKSEVWHRMLENPTVLTFMQGSDTNVETDKISVFAYSGGELVKTDRYFITKIPTTDYLIYHSVRECNKPSSPETLEKKWVCGNCGSINDSSQTQCSSCSEPKDGDDVDTYLYTKGTANSYVNSFYPTMADAAALGATPCPDCIK